MRRIVLLCLIPTLLGPAVLGLEKARQADGGASRPASAPGSQPNAAGRPHRVILHLNRDTELPGTIAQEDENVITIRNLRGEVQSFSKTRVPAIVRLVDPQPDQPGMVVMRDGETRDGVIIEDNFDYVLIEIQGIRAKLKRDSVDHVILQPTLEERYAQYKATLQPGAYDKHFVLCKWLADQRRYDLARLELADLLEKTDMPEAKRLLTIVEAQLALAQKPSPKAASSRAASQPATASAESADDDGVTGSSTGAGPVYAPDLIPDQIISDADVNIIRVYEIDFDAPPKVTVTPETVRAIIEKYGANKLVPASQTGRNGMFRAAADHPLDVVHLMFDLAARDLYAQIQVNSEPHALNLFRERVHNSWLINSCATTHCHGGPFAGGFYLHRKNYKSDRVRYTNLLLLERLKIDPDWPLINYDDPEKSLIIQYALPREAARKAHPKVPGWKPAFNTLNPKMKDDTIEWIKAMMQPRPAYPVDFEPIHLQTQKPTATQPAEAGHASR